MRKVYCIADIHLLNKRKYGNERYDEYILNEFDNFLRKTVEEGSLVVIAGDFFNVPLITSNYNAYRINQAIGIINKYNEEKNIHFILLSGNHDKITNSEVEEQEVNDYNVGILPILSSVSNRRDFNFRNFDESPSLIIIENSISNIKFEEEKINICCIPYMKDYSGIHCKNEEGYKNILVVHDSTKEEVTDKRDPYIDLNKFEGFDYIWKGHVHQSYCVDNLSLYSPGSFVKTKKTDNCGYIEMGERCELKEFNRDKEINYIDLVLDGKNVNKALSKLNELTIANILYKGTKDEIDETEFIRCFNECIKFNFIFEQEMNNWISQEDFSSSDFISCENYLKNNLSEDLFEYFKKFKERLTM